MSLVRQAHLVAAIMIFSGFILAKTANESFIYLALLPGFGLTLDALTGFCPMTKFLSTLPFNKNKEKKASCCN